MKTNFISVDLEDWHTSAYLRDYISVENYCSQIVESTKPILRLFKKKGIKATFFVLGAIADRHPDLIKDISEQGHEIASHGYSHIPLWELTPEEFRYELQATNRILEKITGKKIIGFRAPCASLDKRTAWAIKILQEEGFKYDSSIFPMATPLYGAVGAPKGIYRISHEDIFSHSPNAKIIEFPFTVCNFGPVNIPCTGGIYGRVLPGPIVKYLLKRVSSKRPVNFYFHPWETYGCIPKIKAPFLNRFIRCYQVKAYLAKIEGIINCFKFVSFEDYMEANGKYCL